MSDPVIELSNLGFNDISGWESPACRERERQLLEKISELVTANTRIATLEGNLKTVLERETATTARYDARIAEETAIVNRIWKILGCTTYADAKGKSIYELVEGLQQRIAELEARETPESAWGRAVEFCKRTFGSVRSVNLSYTPPAKEKS